MNNNHSERESVKVLLAIASGQGPVFDKARSMIGEDELALLLATAALAGTSISLSPTRVAKVLEISRDGARKKTENTAVRL
jgi:hypothetical protein